MTIRTTLNTSAFLGGLCAAALFGGVAAADNSAASKDASATAPISAAFPFKKRFVDVKGARMAYVDEGEGPVVLFIHGNPTSSYLWRNIIPYVSDNHRAVAVDLIGMGDSAKPDIDYRFETHAAYLDAFIETLELKDVTLVIHDWGSALGMRYARLNPGKVRALAFMEAIVPPGMPAPNYEAMGQAGEVFRQMRTPGVGEEMVLQNNFFVEVILPDIGVVRTLSDEEMAEYRRPFPTPESRKPTLVWPRQIPIGGEPADTTAAVLANGEWLMASDLPKLYFASAPGALNPPPVAEFFKANLKNLTAVDLGPGAHFLQEDHPHAIGRALSDWLDALDG